METLIGQSSPPSLRGVPFDQKWDLLKSTIQRLYIIENRSLPDVIKSIKDQYGFDAAEPQYKYHIKKWKLKKSISTSKKAAICKDIQKRAELGKSSAIIRAGQDLDTKNLRRYLKTEKRRAITLQPSAGETITDAITLSGRITQSGNRIFMNWNMPYGVMGMSAARAIDHASPLSDIVVTTPTSPREAPSPMAVAVREMSVIERARLFVQGRHIDLLKSLDKPQRITLSTWMYQYWLFAFKTAKHWGRGPQDWTASILGFDDFPQRTMVSISSPNTPAADFGTPASQPILSSDRMIDPPTSRSKKTPSSLCRWSIHCPQIHYEGIPSPPRSPTATFNLDDETNWPTWPRSSNMEEYTEKLKNNLGSNDFSSIKADDMPIAVDHVARAARSSPDKILEEALGFSIMSRNVTLMNDLLAQVGRRRLDVSRLYPFHLAINYLDGSKTCCTILNGLRNSFPIYHRKYYVNELGYTLLDQLMIAILKAHTSCLPSVVDMIFKKEKRFEGEDVDICGRWDADSDCVRTLLAMGKSAIPFEWKDMFCHTSVQTICHCIRIISCDLGDDGSTPSGLFVRRCLHCGLKLQLLPLHTLVLVGLHLSRSGCKDENLFGILACLLCLLSGGANPLLKASISVQALLGNDEGSECSHEELDPAELAEKATTTVESMWSRELGIGWQIICNVLRRSQVAWGIISSNNEIEYDSESEYDSENTFHEDPEDVMDTDEEANQEHCIPADCNDFDDDDHENYFEGDNTLATLWAAVQTELLTYRRLEEGDPWISPNFNMRTLNEGLVSGGKVDVGLVQKGMMKRFCSCGKFSRAAHVGPMLDDAAAYYFANLDDWNRTTFIPFEEWW